MQSGRDASPPSAGFLVNCWGAWEASGWATRGSQAAAVTAVQPGPLVALGPLPPPRVELWMVEWYESIGDPQGVRTAGKQFTVGASAPCGSLAQQ